MAWTQSGNIKGASGTPGASGASGIPGASGASGASGAAGTTTWSGITDKPAVIAAGVDSAAARNVISAEYTGNKGQPSGYAALDASGLVPSSQLPSFVDDVVEAANLAAFPATGESGKIYTALDTNKVYRWGGSSYTEISPSPGSTDAVPEGSTNLYYTAARADGRITAAVGSSIQAYSATLTTYASKTAPTGAVVGTTDTQTLTNKDLTAGTNTFPTFNQNTTGNAATATKLATARTINGVSFDGSANITVPAGINRSILTITDDITLASAANTDYVYFVSSRNNASTSVKLLLKGNGANGGTSFSDSSTFNRTITRSGATTSTTQSKFGGASISVSSGQYVSATSSDFAFGTGPFTCDAWIYPTSFNSFNSIMGTRQTTGLITTGFSIMCDSNGVLFIFNDGFLATSATGTITTNTWQHVAASRSGNTIRLFKNGTQVGTATYSYNNTNTTFSVGALIGDSSQAFNGFVDEVRVTNTAEYTSNFTAPTAEYEGFTPAGPTLPSASSVGSNHYTIKNISGVSTTVKVTSAQLIDGASGGLTLENGALTRIVSDGTQWRTV